MCARQFSVDSQLQQQGANRTQESYYFHKPPVRRRLGWQPVNDHRSVCPKRWLLVREDVAKCAANLIAICTVVLRQTWQYGVNRRCVLPFFFLFTTPIRRHTEMDLPKRRSPPGPSKAPMMATHPPPSANDKDDDELWTLVAGSKPTGKKAVVYVGNLKKGAKEDEVREFIQKKCAKLRLRPPKIYNSKMFEKEPEEGEIIEFSCARLTIDYGSLESICDRQFWPGRSYARPWKFNGQNINTPDDSTKN